MFYLYCGLFLESMDFLELAELSYKIVLRYGNSIFVYKRLLRIYKKASVVAGIVGCVVELCGLYECEHRKALAVVMW